MSRPRPRGCQRPPKPAPPPPPSFPSVASQTILRTSPSRPALLPARCCAPCSPAACVPRQVRLPQPPLQPRGRLRNRFRPLLKWAYFAWVSAAKLGRERSRGGGSAAAPSGRGCPGSGCCSRHRRQEGRGCCSRPGPGRGYRLAF